MKAFLLTLLLLSIPLLPVHAAKVRVRKAPTKTSVSASYATVKKSKPTHSLKLFFSSLGNVSKISYEVEYTSNGRSQGIVGSFTPTGGTSDVRDVYLGTCSSGVCTPHANPKTIVVVIRVTLKTGGVYTKVARAASF